MSLKPRKFLKEIHNRIFGAHVSGKMMAKKILKQGSY